MKPIFIFILVAYGLRIPLFAQLGIPPTIMSLTPTGGPIGTSVIITGTGFDPTPINNIVFFGATQATVIDATTTELTVIVPDGATHMPVTVLVNGSLAYSPKPFALTFDGTGIDAESFDNKLDFATGIKPEALVSADFDGDKKADLAIVNENANSISILRNISTSPGNISFAEKIDYSTGDSPFTILTGDLDGDGKPDLAVGILSSLSISVFRNTTSGAGNISFAPGVDFFLGAWNQPYSISIGDFDSDGRADLAAAMYHNNRVSVLRNTSSGPGTIDFAAKIDFQTGDSPVSISVGDFDGDSKPDLAVANANDNILSIFRNTSTSPGTISFNARLDYPTGKYPRSVSTGDLNGDNKVDVAVACQSDNLISVFRNTSSGDGDLSFHKKDFAAEASPVAVSIGNVDGDGRLDLAVSNNNRVSVFRNKGTTGVIDFASKVNYPTGSNPRSVSIGDLDSDGKPELAIANKNDNTVSILRNTITQGSATAIVAFTFPSQTGAPNIDTINHTIEVEVAGSDLNSLVASYTLSTGAIAKINSVVQVSGFTANDFTNPLTYTIWDTDGVTSQDWVVTITLKSLTPPVITSFTPASGPTGTLVTIVGVGFDPLPANNIVYFGASQATVLTATATELTVTVPAGATYQPLTVLANKLTGYSSAPFTVTFDGKGIDSNSFAPKVDFSIGMNSICMGDLDRDGKPDLIGGRQAGKTAAIALSRNITDSIGTPDFGTSISYTLGSIWPASGSVGPVKTSVGDFDNDGKLDIAAVTLIAFDFLYVFMNTSSGPGIINYSEKVMFPSSRCSAWVSDGDFNRDGKRDLVVANQCDNFISIFRNTSMEPGTINFATKIDFPVGIKPSAISTGDLDGDGNVDLAVANFGSNTVSILRNTGSSNSVNFEPKVDFPTGAGPFSVSTGDLDNDGKTDLVVANSNSNTISVFRNTSTDLAIISFTPSADYMTESDPRSVEICDLNGDGKVDLAVTNMDSNTVSVFSNISTGPGSIGFAARLDYATGPAPTSVTMGDLDGDGKADLVVANGSASILRNTVKPPSSETDIIGFSLSEQTAAAIISSIDHTINIEVTKETDVSALVATYTLSPGATAKVNGIVQVSSTTTNDFTDPVTYRVTAEDELTSQDWVVTVTIKPNETPLISDASFTLDENSPKGTQVGRVSALDPDGDTLNFFIVSGNESEAFRIDQITGELSVADSSILDFEINITFTLEVEVSDGELTDIAIITIHLNNVDETSVVGIDPVSKSFDVYPNPVSNMLTIRWLEFESCMILEPLGRLVLTSSNNELHVSELPSGLYILILTSKTKKQIPVRIIKE